MSRIRPGVTSAVLAVLTTPTLAACSSKELAQNTVDDYNQTIAQDFIPGNRVAYPSIYDPPFRTTASLGGEPTSVVPTTIVSDREHRPAALFLHEVDADDILDFALPLTEEAPQS